jgi:hypothetical protein
MVRALVIKKILSVMFSKNKNKGVVVGGAFIYVSFATFAKLPFDRFDRDSSPPSSSILHHINLPYCPATGEGA